MNDNRLAQLNRDFGQSIWVDFISRDALASGELARLVTSGVLGLTSNPSIFEKAISGSEIYDADIAALAAAGKSVNDIYEGLALADIAAAADLLYPVYVQTDGLDGYVSLEVSPELAYDTPGTIADAKRLFAALGRPNVMIKIPGTSQGIPAIAEVIGSGINVNVTLLFALEAYEAAANAYLDGLEALARAGGDLHRVASVASFFVSRVDTSVDRQLKGHLDEAELRGKAAIANARLAYAIFQELFSGPRWEALAAQGARVQRPLWASTSTKDPAYPDTMYVDELIGPHTVNTLPPPTLEAFADHGVLAETITANLDDATQLMADLAEAGIDMEQVTDDLLRDGVKSFADAFTKLMNGLKTKVDNLSVV